MKKAFKGFGVYFLILILVSGLVLFYGKESSDKVSEVSYSKIVEHISKEELKEITFKELEITGILKREKSSHICSQRHGREQIAYGILGQAESKE